MPTHCVSTARVVTFQRKFIQQLVAAAPPISVSMSTSLMTFARGNKTTQHQRRDKIEHVAFEKKKKNHAFQHTSSLAKMFFIYSLCHLHAHSYTLSIMTIHITFITSCICIAHTGWEHGEIKSVSKVKTLNDHKSTRTTPNHHVLGIFRMLKM